ncbi:phosphomannomutase [candidate division WOR_3 bacterium SM23_42]|uniref:Phosphomannomutase n=1 Tax=candidate division WOR_3 bacterium SM23_42 TaxID=1703779 RepID=A0A0S8FSG7_UNCW3|nr:MAG: phosphomannomutase [candidate division WOR_3 bacterium SM23_42]
MINPSIFREYDIRGLAQDDLNDDDVYLFARGVGSYYRAHGQKDLFVGQDMRISSPRIAKTLIKGLNETGCNVIDIGMVPTPVLYFALFHYKIENGIMITASHNPKEFNGFKVARNKSTIYGNEIQHLRKRIEEGKFESGQGVCQKKDLLADYVNYVTHSLEIKKDLKVAVDTGNGTCGPVFEQILKKLGLDYLMLYKEPDGTFPNHLPDPVVPDHIKELINTVKSGDFSCGIGFDGDGDRIGALDENGQIIWGDVLLAIYAEELLARMPGAKIIFEVKCSKGLIERIEELGGIPLMYKTGHSLIKAKMKEEEAPLAGEMSGHIFFADRYYGYDDAIYAALRLFEILSRGEKLSALAKRVPKYYSTPEIRIDTTDEAKFQIVEELKSFFKKSYRVIDIDGVRVDFDDGWGLIRPSNTQPVLVLRFEAKTEARLEEIRKIFFDKLAEHRR